jgi:hypothetical protein
MNRYFSKEDIQMICKYMGKKSTSPCAGEIQFTDRSVGKDFQESKHLGITSEHIN